MATENPNKYIAVNYKLYTSAPDEEPELVEETAEGDPFIFVSALGMTLDAFEAQIVPLKMGDAFDSPLPQPMARANTRLPASKICLAPSLKSTANLTRASFPKELSCLWPGPMAHALTAPLSRLEKRQSPLTSTIPLQARA